MPSRAQEDFIPNSGKLASKLYSQETASGVWDGLWQQIWLLCNSGQVISFLSQLSPWDVGQDVKVTLITKLVIRH